MKKIILILAACLTLTGCAKQAPPAGQAPISSDAPLFVKGVPSVDVNGGAPKRPANIVDPNEHDPFIEDLGTIVFPLTTLDQPRIMQQVIIDDSVTVKPYLISSHYAMIYTNSGSMWSAKRDDVFSLSFDFQYNHLIREEIEYHENSGTKSIQGIAIEIDPTQRFEIGYILDGAYTALSIDEITESDVFYSSDVEFRAPTDGAFLFVLLSHSTHELGVVNVDISINRKRA